MTIRLKTFRVRALLLAKLFGRTPIKFPHTHTHPSDVNRSLIVGYITLVFVVLLLGSNPSISAKEPAIDPVKMEQTVEAVLKQMTLEEKVLMCQGGSPRGTAVISRLGIREMLFYNGNRGTHKDLGFEGRKATFFPSGIGQAATWDPDMLEKIGAAIALEAKEKNFPVLLAPSINIQRDPVCGRVFEYFTEDPFLNGRLTAAFVNGVQSERVVACAKHYAANSQEFNRDDVSSEMDERTFREIYLPGFEAAVNAGVWSVMSGANRFRGESCCQNNHLLNEVLKNDLGFKGFVVTDWSGAKNTVKAANGGCDLSMPGKPIGPFSKESLLAALDSGAVKEATIDDKVRRLLRAAYFCGHLDGSPPWENTPVDFQAHSQLALEAAREGIVLLKNEGGLLPLDRGKIKSIAVIGPNADRGLFGGGSSGVDPAYYITALQGLRDRLKEGVKIIAVPFDIGTAWEMISDQYVTTVDGKPGLEAVFSGIHTGTKNDPAKLSRIDSKIDFNWEMASPDRFVIDPSVFKGEWHGKLHPPVSGAYFVRISGSGDDINLLLDGKQILRKFQGTMGLRSINTTVNLEQGKEYDLTVRYSKKAGDAWVKLDWIRPDSKEAMAKAMAKSVAAAKEADVALVFAGLDHGYDTEAADRENLRIPPFQDTLIEAVRKANPKTVVILNNGSPIEMDPWLPHIPAVLEAWYPGQEHGHAVADVLWGDYNPGGKLPITFPAHYVDSPAHPSRQKEDRQITTKFNEGVFVGYRWFDDQKIEPLFPFGFGLSYTSFDYKNLRVEKVGEQVRVSMDLTNIGSRDGAEVVQFYVTPPKSDVLRPPQELKGFARVFLKPGETRRVDVVLDSRVFAYWDEKVGKWTISPGSYGVEAGSSSRDIRLTSSIKLQAEVRLPTVSASNMVLQQVIAASAAETVSLESLLNEMVATESIARWPSQEFTCKQASSYDRAKVAPDKPGWFANHDHTQYIRSEETDGRKEQVMMDADGAGAIVRFWLTAGGDKQGVIRVYLDGEKTPALTFTDFDLLKGDLKFGAPLAQAHPGYRPNFGGNNLYLPIPYAKHCKVTWEEKSKSARYYQINYRTYAPGTVVQTFALPQVEAASKLINEVNRKLNSPAPFTGGKVLSLNSELAAGAEAALELPAGANAVRGLELLLKTGDAKEVERTLRSLMVKLTFDGEETAWCPATDFFGSGVGINELRSWYRDVSTDGTMRCRWVMPYEKSATITLQNVGSQSVKASLHATTAPWKWDDRSMHFHAAWHYEAGLKTPPHRDWNFIHINGRGVYAGDSLAIYNPVATWYGEGDEKIWVDGESFPSHLGTGTEDYYNYSYAPKPVHQTPFANLVRMDQPMTQGWNVMSRTRQLDGIPFQQSFQFDMELISAKPTTLIYCATTYWYAFPGATSNLKPQPQEAKLPVPTLADAKAVAE